MYYLKSSHGTVYARVPQIDDRLDRLLNQDNNIRACDYTEMFLCSLPQHSTINKNIPGHPFPRPPLTQSSFHCHLMSLSSVHTRGRCTPSTLLNTPCYHGLRWGQSIPLMYCAVGIRVSVTVIMHATSNRIMRGFDNDCPPNALWFKI